MLSNRDCRGTLVWNRDCRETLDSGFKAAKTESMMAASDCSDLLSSGNLSASLEVLLVMPVKLDRLERVNSVKTLEVDLFLIIFKGNNLFQGLAFFYFQHLNKS